MVSVIRVLYDCAVCDLMQVDVLGCWDRRQRYLRYDLERCDHRNTMIASYVD